MEPTRRPGDAVDPVDVVCVGETMVAFVGTEDGASFRAVPAGAESNVAMAMARLGCAVQWVSRLGDDELGRRLEGVIGGAGVAVAVVRDEAHPTGTLVKHVSRSGARVQYYRSESAARLLSRRDLERVAQSGWIHVTGITPALSAAAADLVEAIMERVAGTALVSFDVNHRPVLWPDDAAAADTLCGLARRADLVFIGDDEADRLIGASDPDSVASALLSRPGQQIVLKRGPGPATVISPDARLTERPLPVEVVDLVGAGDAFAAGYLAGAVFGWDTLARLRLAHFMASRVVIVHDDVVPPFTTDERAGITPDRLDALWAATG